MKSPRWRRPCLCSRVAVTADLEHGDMSLTYPLLAWKIEIQYPKAGSGVVPTTTGSWKTHPRGTPTVCKQSRGCLNMSGYTDRICVMATPSVILEVIPEVIANTIHGGSNRGFEELSNLFAIRTKSIGISSKAEGVATYPVNINFPFSIPQSGSSSSGEPNSTQ